MRLPRGTPPRATASTPALTPLLVVSRRRTWRGVTGQFRRLHILGLGLLVGRGLGAVSALARGSDQAASTSIVVTIIGAPTAPCRRRIRRRRIVSWGGWVVAVAVVAVRVRIV